MYPRPSFPAPIPLGQMSHEERYWAQQQQQHQPLEAAQQDLAEQQQASGQAFSVAGAVGPSAQATPSASTAMASPADRSAPRSAVETGVHSYPCRSCDPPVWLSSNGALRRHRVNEHILHVQVTLRSGEVYRVARNDQGFFRCPSCKHNSKSADYLPTHVRKTVRSCRWDEKWPFALPDEWEKIEPSTATKTTSPAPGPTASSPVASPSVASPRARVSSAGPASSAPPASFTGPSLPSIAPHYTYGPIPTGAILPPPPMMSFPRSPVQGPSAPHEHGTSPVSSGGDALRPAQLHFSQQHQQRSSAYPHPDYHSLADLGSPQPWFRSPPGPPNSTQDSGPRRLDFNNSNDFGGGSAVGGQTSRSISGSSASGVSHSQAVPSPAALAEAAHSGRQTLPPAVYQWYRSLPAEQQQRITAVDPRAAIAHFQASPFGQQQMMQQQQQQAHSPSSFSKPPASLPIQHAPPGSATPSLSQTWTLPGIYAGVPLAPAQRGVGQVGLPSGPSLNSSPMAERAKSAPSASPSPTPAASEPFFRAGVPAEISFSLPVRADEVAAIATRASATVLEKEEQFDAASTAATAGSSSVAADLSGRDAEQSFSPGAVDAAFMAEDGAELEGKGRTSTAGGDDVSAANQSFRTFDNALALTSGSCGSIVPVAALSGVTFPRSSPPTPANATPQVVTADLVYRDTGVDHDPSIAFGDSTTQAGEFETSFKHDRSVVPAVSSSHSPVRPSAIPSAAMPEIRPGTPTSPSAVVSAQADPAGGSAPVVIPLHDVVITQAMAAEPVAERADHEGDDAAKREAASALPFDDLVDLVSGDGGLADSGVADGE